MTVDEILGDCMDFGEDEPMMDGSDDELSDTEEINPDHAAYDSDNEDLAPSNPSPLPSSSPSVPALDTPPTTSATMTATPSTPDMAFFQIHPFTSYVGPADPLPESALEVFELFFTPQLRKWDKVTTAEFKAFFGFSILMAINHLPSVDDYWKKDPYLHYSPPLCQQRHPHSSWL